MTPSLAFRFFLADRCHPVDPNAPPASAPLPLARTAADDPGAGNGGAVTYGDYFHAVGDFLSNNAGALCRAWADAAGRPLSPGEIERVDVFLAKHGEFYHPCRVVPVTARPLAEMALNGAVSPAGRRALPREYRHLERLGCDFPFDFIPRVYARGEGRDLLRRPIPMFLAQWFSGFHECHLSLRGDRKGDTARMRVWTGDGQDRFLSPSETAGFYRQCAFILTCYYNPLTFEQIFPWHHAAGDFVVACRPGGVDVRLVTVRDYGCRFRAPGLRSALQARQGAERPILEGLLVFFLAMSLRMRLDRRDGVGEVLWAPAAALTGTVDGFFQGLAIAALHSGLPEGVPALFRRFLMAHPPEDLAALCGDIGDRYPEASEERRMIRRRCGVHARALYRRVTVPPSGI